MLADEGAITSPDWREAFDTVPRHLFTPRFFLDADEGGFQAVDSGDPEWLASVYSDRPLVIQLDTDDSAWHRIREAGPTSHCSNARLALTTTVSAPPRRWRKPS